jgi:hypothetical protein
MEAWRQWPLGGRKKRVPQKSDRTRLTPTGLLMEGDYTQKPDFECNGDVTKADGPLSIIWMDNSQNYPDEKSKRGHTERDEIVS